MSSMRIFTKKQYDYSAFNIHSVLLFGIYDLSIILCIIILTVSPILDYCGVGIFSYADEIVAIIIVFSSLFSSRIQRSEIERVGIICIYFCCIIGIVGNIFHAYQRNNFAIAVDAFTCLKMFAVFFAARRLFFGKHNLLDLIAKFAKLFIFVSFACYLIHLLGFVSMGGDRNVLGIPSFQFLYGHPTEFAAYLVGFATILLSKRGNYVWIFLCAILLLATQRSKAVAMSAVLIALAFYNLFKRANKRPPFIVVVLIFASIILIGMDQISYYYGNSSSARTLLSQVSFNVANSLFPIGAGFATYGTFMSGSSYSSLYYQYHLSSIYGLTPDNPIFVSDCFWPAVFAQFGYLGFVIIVLLIVSLFTVFYNKSKCNHILFSARICIPLYLLIASSSESAFFNFYGVFYAILMAMLSTNFAEIGNRVNHAITI